MAKSQQTKIVANKSIKYSLEISFRDCLLNLSVPKRRDYSKKNLKLMVVVVKWIAQLPFDRVVVGSVPVATIFSLFSTSRT